MGSKIPENCRANRKIFPVYNGRRRGKVAVSLDAGLFAGGCRKGSVSMGRSIRDAQTLTEHLEELRKRLIICLVTVLAATAMSFTLTDRLYAILTAPAGNLQLIFVTPPEAMLAHFRLAFLAGLTLALPMILYQLVAFVMPGLYKEEIKIIIPALLGMVLFFALGVSFAYLAVFPLAVRFFLQFAGESVVPMFTVSNYLSFAANFMFAFGLVFQLPLVFYLLGRLQIVDARFLRTHRKYALLVVAAVSALLTPPDVISQLLMAVPLAMLYELGIWLVVLSRRGRREAAPE
jgi:sec-independent protein translocase protein TatC